MNPSAAEVCAYLFRRLRERHGRGWRGSRFSGQTRARADDPLSLLRAHMLKGVPGAAHAGLLGWLEGRYPIDLLHHIPTPGEMFAVQCRGRRWLTLMAAPEAQERRYGRHAGALEFLLHDLEHAQKFFGNPDLRRAQILFFNLLRGHLHQLDFLCGDPRFRSDLNYLISDMNTHPLHMLKYLKAVILTAFQRIGGSADYEEFVGIFLRGWPLPPAVLDAALRINQPGRESGEDQRRFSDWFLTYDPSHENLLTWHPDWKWSSPVTSTGVSSTARPASTAS